MKKIISVILAAFMLASLVPTLSFAEDNAAVIPAATPDENGHIMLFDLGNPATHTTAGYENASPSGFAYDGKSSSLKWEMKIGSDSDGNATSAPNVYLPYTASDLSAYSSSEEATVNVRFYSEAAGSKFNIVFYGTTLSSYYRKGLTTIEGGWQVYQVLLKDVMDKLTNYSSEKTIRITFNDDGWNNLKNEGYNDGDTVYIDQIWVDTNPDGYYEGKNVIWRADTDTTTATNCTSATKLSVNPIINKYREFNMTGATTIKILDGSSTIISKGSYKWLNAWIYSEKPQDDGFHINFNASSTRCEIKQVDWSGWKLISLALPSSLNITDVYILGYNYRTNSTNQINSGNKDSITGLKIGIDNIWVSNETTSPQETYEASLKSAVSVSSAYKTTTDDLMNVNFNNSDNIYNPHIYTKNKRLSFNSVTYKDLVAYSDGTSIPAAKKVTFHVYDSESDSAADIHPTSTSYVNAWIYNPVPKYTWNGTDYAEIILVLRYRNGNDFVNKKIFIIADWSGWKLVSIPVTAFGSDLAGKDVYDVYFQCNGGWYPVSKGVISAHTHTDEELALGYRTGNQHNVFGGYDSTYKYTYYNYFNYIDIERVWISEGAPKSAGEVVMADNSTLKCPETTGKEIDLFTATNAGKIDVNVIAKNEDSCTKLDASILSDGTLVLPSDIGFDTDYYVWTDIYAPNGDKTSMEFTFSSEDYHISDKNITGDGRTATITMHGLLTGEYTNSIMIAAVYTEYPDEGSGGAKKLEAAIVGETANDGTVTVTIPESVGIDGKKVSFFFFDSENNIKPLDYNIQK